MIIDNPIVSGSLNVQNAVTASNISIASTASAAYFTGSFVGDGTQLSGVTSYTDADTLDYINSLGVLSGSAQIATDISGAFASTSQSLAERIASQESFSQSLDATFATDQELSNVSGALALSISNISTDFADITNKPTLISSSAQFTDLTAPFTGSFTGSFYGDGSNLSGVTSYTDADTLAYINSRAVLSGSIAELTAVTASFLNTGSVTIPHSFNSKNVSVSVYDSNDILIIPQEIALISNNAVKLTFGGSTSGFAVVSKGGHIVSGSVPVPQLSTVTSAFTSATSHTVTHNFNTKEVIVSVYENDSLIIPDTVTTDDVNNVTVTFPEAISGRVVVVKAGHIVSGSIPFDNLLDSPFVQSATAVTASKSIVPSQDITYDLGSSDKRFRDLYLSSASIYLGNTVISEDNVVTTASLQSVLPAGTLSGSAQIASDISGSFTLVSASIASERLKNTTDTLDGDLTVTGKITAQEFHTEYVSASILYDSGSTQFGNSADDTHLFQGKVGIGIAPYSTAQLSINSGTRDYILYGQSSDANAFISLRDDSSTTNVIFGAVGNNHVFMKDTTEHMRIDSSGRVGIGVEPSAWTFNVLQIKNSSVWTTGNDLGLSANSYYDGTNYRYIGAAATSRIYHNTDGSINFSNAPAGTAGNIVTFSERMKVNADGSVSFNQGSTSIPVGGISHYTNNYLYIKGGTAGAAIGNDDFTGAVYVADNSDITLTTSNSDSVVVKADGNVGIGTSNPSTTLTVGKPIDSLSYGSGTRMIDLKSYFTGYDQDTVKASIYAGVSSIPTLRTDNGYLAFMTANTNTLYERMRIETNGNVGIGTDSPEGKLDVRAGSGGKMIFGSYDANYNVTIQGGNQIDFYNGTSIANGYINYLGGGTGVSQNLFVEKASAGTAGTVRINSDGNLGIGDTSPAKKLEVKISDNTDGVYFAQTIGGSRASAGYSVGIGMDPEGYGGRNKVGIVVQGHPSGWSAGKMHFLNRLDIGTNGEADLSHSRMTIDYTGYVGIGSQTPQTALDVRGGAVTRVRINSNSGTNAGVLLAENGTDYWSFASTSGGNLQFFREGGGGNKMMLTTDGNLGINTTSPSYKLDVEGAVAFTDEILARSGTASISNAGYVWENKFTGNGVYIHLKTNIVWGGSTQMYSLHFLGYAYGEANPVNAQIGFYNYPPSSAPINVGSSGSHTIVLYESSDGYIVIRIQFANSYFTGLTMSARNTAQGVTWPSITATAQNGTSNHF